MKIKITGSSGYLGKLISSNLQIKGYEVTAINREFLYGSTEKLQNEIKNADVIINLAGAPILQRWTKNNKHIIYNSRIITTTNLVRAINALKPEEQPAKFISASAIGIYKSGYQHNENSQNFDLGFVGKVTTDWENSIQKLSPNIQKNIFRIGLVLGKDAKIIKSQILPFKLGLGAKLGNGKQAFPFIHEQDLVNAFVWAVENLDKSETFNLVAPEKITNKVFTEAFASILKRPAFFFIPGFIIKIILGEAACLLLESPSVEPKNLLDSAFKFKHETINSSLSEILT